MAGNEDTARVPPDPDDPFGHIPENRFTPGGRKRLNKLFKQFDTLGRLDPATGDVSIDEPALRGMLREHLPTGFEDPFVAGLRRLPDARLTAADARLKPVKWHHVAKRIGPDGPPDETYEGLGLSIDSMPDEIRRAVKKRRPDVADALFDPDRLVRIDRSIVERLADATRRPGTPDAGATVGDWDYFFQCFLITFGFFFCFMVLGLIMMMFILVFVEGVLLIAALGMGLKALGFGSSFLFVMTLQSCICTALLEC